MDKRARFVFVIISIIFLILSILLVFAAEIIISYKQIGESHLIDDGLNITWIHLKSESTLTTQVFILDVRQLQGQTTSRTISPSFLHQG